MSRMRHSRVLLLQPSTGMGGGIEVYAAGLEQRLVGLGLEVETVALRPDGAAPDKFAFARQVVDAVRSGAPTLAIGCHVSMIPYLRVARLVGRRLRTLTVLHGREVWGARAFVRIAIRFAGPLVCASPFTAGYAASMVGHDHIQVLDPPLPTGRFESLRQVGTQRVARITDGQLQILSVGRLAEWRGKFAGLVAAVAELQRGGADVTLRICGSSPVAPELADAARRWDWLELSTDLPLSELVDAYASADVFALVTSFARDVGTASGEGFGIVLAEAQLAGLPVVAATPGGSASALQPGLTGSLVVVPRHGSRTALVEALRDLASDGDRLRHEAEWARRWASAFFDPQASANRVAAVIDGVT